MITIIFLTEWYPHWAFAISAPKLWNELPLENRLSSSILVSKSSLKTQFYITAFSALPWLISFIYLLISAVLNVLTIDCFYGFLFCCSITVVLPFVPWSAVHRGQPAQCVKCALTNKLYGIFLTLICISWKILFFSNIKSSGVLST